MGSQWWRVVVDGFALEGAKEEPRVLLRSPDHGRTFALPIEVHNARAIIEELEYGDGHGRLPDVVAQLLISHGFCPRRLNVLIPRHGSSKAELSYEAEGMEHRLPMRLGEGLVLAMRLGVPLFLRSDRQDLPELPASPAESPFSMRIPLRAG
ncbi:MAG: hypothetical protein ACOCW6_03675 [Spirochaetota bacterium]